MRRYQALTDGWAINGEILKTIADEGYTVLRIISPESNKLLLCETVRISKDAGLPQGANTVLGVEEVRNYGNIIFIENVFPKFKNTK